MVNIKELLVQGEKATFEAKKAEGGLPKSFWESYAAFANTNGGIIALGVEETAAHELVAVGVKDPERMIKDIWNGANNPHMASANVLFEEHVYAQAYDGVDLVIVEVPRADRHDKPVFIRGNVLTGTYRRNGDGDYRCTRELINGMMRDAGDTPVDATVLEEMSLEDLEAESVNAYRTIFRQLKEGHVWNKLNDAEFLAKIGAARRGSDGKLHPTRAGLLCFGNFVNIIEEFPNYFLDYRERLGGPALRWSDRVCSGDAYWSGNIIDFYFRVNNKISSGLKRPFKLDGRMFRVDDTPLHKSMREALANMLIHADYFGQRGLVIDKFADRVVLSNPGNVRVGVSVAVGGGISDARNAKIFNIFSLIDIGERAGSGLCNLYEMWRDAGLAKPKFSESFVPDRTELVLPLLPADERKAEEWAQKWAQNLGSEPIDKLNEPIFNFYGPIAEPNKPSELNKRAQSGQLSENNPAAENSEQALLALLKKKPDMTRLGMAEELNVSLATIKRMIVGLKSAGRLTRQGDNRNGKWIVSDI